MALETYRKKRDFGLTPEPHGARAPAKGNRFVIQKHAARRLHYDLRLELDGVMKSWAVTRGPSLVPGEKRLAVHVEDHPIEYNKFEGNIPKGEYGGGAVMIWDRGRWIPEDDPHRGYAKGNLAFRLEGEKLKGRWHLVRMQKRPGEKHEPWLLIKSSDEEARDAKAPDILEEQPRSVVSDRTIDEIAENKPVKRKRVPAARAPAQKHKPTTSARKKTVRARAKTPPARKQAGKAKQRTKSPDPSVPDPADIPGARRAALPDFVPPSLATLHAKPPSGAKWVHEIKFDGYRLQARIADGMVRLITRRGLDWTAKFGPVAAAMEAVPAGRALIDGEVVVEEESGKSSFSALQADLSARRTDRFVYYAFDLLHLDGYDLTGSPLIERKQALRALLAGLPGHGILRYSEHFDADGALLLEHACRMRLEGIVSKEREGLYHSGRSNDWIKAKCSDRQEFVVAGYGPSTVLQQGVGSLVLGYHEDGELRYAGRVGTGFNQKSAREMWQRLEPLRTDKPPFAKLPPEEKRRPVRWVKPQAVVEVDFRGWTADRLVRHAAFKGVREDKPAREIVREMPAAARRTATAGAKLASATKRSVRARASSPLPSVRLTNPDRVYWPDVGITKQRLAEYYTEIWDWIAPHLVGRPLSLVRCPDGITGQCFYQKHVSAGLEGTHMHRIPDKDAKDFFAIQDLEGLLALVQAGVLEIHVWGCKVQNIEECDRVVFDLDPGPRLEWTVVIDAAREVRQRLKALGLESFVKTSGGKGLHVVLPLQGAGWDEAKDFAHAIARAMAADNPARYTANMAKSKRTGRIFVDYLRNGRGATSIVAYSTRARPGAAISAPVRWDELGSELPADRFTVLNIGKRLAQLRRDPWADIGRIKQRLPKAAARKKRA